MPFSTAKPFQNDLNISVLFETFLGVSHSKVCLKSLSTPKYVVLQCLAITYRSGMTSQKTFQNNFPKDIPERQLSHSGTTSSFGNLFWNDVFCLLASHSETTSFSKSFWNDLAV